MPLKQKYSSHRVGVLSISQSISLNFVVTGNPFCVPVIVICIDYQRLERIFEGELTKEGEGGGGQELTGVLGLLNSEGNNGRMGRGQAEA